MTRARAARLLRRAAALALIAVALWLIGLWRFAAAIPQRVVEPDRPTDAIVVLTGGSLRVASGLRLLAAGKAKKLFISGVNREVALGDLLRASGQPPESVACCIVLGHAADDTAGNARETARWMAEEGFHSLRLVTASYHMPRSLFEFSHAMPDVDIVPNPVFPAFLRARPWWSTRTGLLVVGSEYTKYLAARLRAILPRTLAPEGAAG